MPLSVLGLSPENALARQCKLVAMIQLGDLEGAYKFAKSKDLKSSAGLEKERAYCFYRNGQLEKALELVTQAGGSDAGALELQGQLLYRLGRMEESKKIYETLLSHQQKGSFGFRSKVKADLLGNIIAAYLAAGDAAGVGPVINQHGTGKTLQETPEIAYNNACVSVALEQYDEAQNLLETAERVGYDSLYV